MDEVTLPKLQNLVQFTTRATVDIHYGQHLVYNLREMHVSNVNIHCLSI
jgi:hypothetical protein